MFEEDLIMWSFIIFFTNFMVVIKPKGRKEIGGV
jgi:hypothetical protein